MFFFFQAEDGIRDLTVTGVQTCALPIYTGSNDTLGKAGATIIAHENTKLWMGAEFHVQWQSKTYKPRAKEARPNKTFFTRSEERRVGKECRSRWSRYH